MTTGEYGQRAGAMAGHGDGRTLSLDPSAR